MQYKVYEKKYYALEQYDSSPPELRSHLNSECTVFHVELETSWPVTTLWILLSFLVSTISTIAYVHPEWYVKEHFNHTELLRYDRSGLVSTLGMVSVCYKSLTGHHRDEMECHSFGEDFPSSTWQTAYVLYGSGCVLLTWCFILSFCNVWIVGRKNRQLVALLVGRIQLMAVVLQASSLLLYPLVLGSPFARLHCGSRARMYSPGGCRLGWAYIAAITSTVLACYCPLLSHFTYYNKFSPCPWTDI